MSWPLFSRGKATLSRGPFKPHAGHHGWLAMPITARGQHGILLLEHAAGKRIARGTPGEDWPSTSRTHTAVTRPQNLRALRGEHGCPLGMTRKQMAAGTCLGPRAGQVAAAEDIHCRHPKGQDQDVATAWPRWLYSWSPHPGSGRHASDRNTGLPGGRPHYPRGWTRTCTPQPPQVGGVGLKRD